MGLLSDFTNPVNSAIGDLTGGGGGSNILTQLLGSSLFGFGPMLGFDALKGMSGGGGGQPTLPSHLPSLGFNPKVYDPNSFVTRQNAPGAYNAMAGALAGPMYQPRVMPGALPVSMATPAASTGGNPSPAGTPSMPSPQLNPAMMALMRRHLPYYAN